MEGTVECRSCYGKKVIQKHSNSIWDGQKIVRSGCPQCQETGVVFWIDEVMGRNRKRRKRQWKKRRRKDTSVGITPGEKKVIRRIVHTEGGSHKKIFTLDELAKSRGKGTVFWIDEIMGRNKKRRKRQWRNICRGINL